VPFKGVREMKKFIKEYWLLFVCTACLVYGMIIQNTIIVVLFCTIIIIDFCRKMKDLIIKYIDKKQKGVEK
jgi:hypothetical protein